MVKSKRCSPLAIACCSSSRRCAAPGPKRATKLADLLCGRLRSSDERVVGLALQQLPTRLAKTLLRFASTNPAATSRQPQVQLSQRELGNICGATRETVNKCLNTWQRLGIVRID